MIEFSLIESLLGGGLGVAILGWIYQSFKTSGESREARLKAAEDKLTELVNIDTRVDGSIKRVHDRMDNIENSQNKLESRLDNDIQDVKRSIDKLTDLVIKALQNKGD